MAKHPTWAGPRPRGAEPGCEEASGRGGASGPAGLSPREASGERLIVRREGGEALAAQRGGAVRCAGLRAPS